MVTVLCVYTTTTTRKQKRHDERNEPHLHRKWQELEPYRLRRLRYDLSLESHGRNRSPRPHLLDALRLLGQHTKEGYQMSTLTHERLTATHAHRKSDAAWRIQYGDAAGYGAAQIAFHGDCDVTGTHVLVAICACGASLVVCPAGGNRPERRKWQA